MAQTQKIVHVPDVGVIAFPGDLEDDHVKRLIKSFREKKDQPKITEESEHARQLKPAQPLSTAIPKLPAWANTPLVSDKDLEETPAGQALTAKSQAEFAKAHPKIEAALEKANTPVVLSGLQGVKEFTQGMLTPANMALMLGAPESKILSGIFATQAMRGSYSDAKAAQKAFEAGNNPEAIKYATQALLGLGVGALAGKHAYKGLPEGVRTQLASEEGSATLPTALKPTTAYQTVDQSKPFYLKSENLINEKMKGPMPAEDVHKMLLSNGVKPEEMQWTGLDELLKGKGKSKVTPQEIQEHLAGNNLQIQEVQKGEAQQGRELKEPHELWQVVDKGKPVYGIKKSNGLVASEGTTGFDSKGLATFLDLHRDDYSIHEGTVPEASPTKYGSYTLPGGENYREMLLTMPSKALPAPKIEFSQATSYKGEPVYVGKLQNGMPVTIHHNPGFPWRVDYPHGESDGGFPTAEAAKESVQNNQRYNPAPESPDYQTNHWGEPNVLGHIRFNDRTGPNGEKILHLEELQSDWHQKGRTHRYVDPKKPFSVPTVQEHFATRAEAEAAATANKISHNLIDDERTSDRPEGAVPDAPFKKTWPELMLKRMIQYAATHGYSGISWTPGEEQAERYSLDKHLSRISYNPETQTLYAADLDGRSAINERVPPEKLPDTIGKETTEKLLATERQQDPLFKKEKTHQLSGSGLKVESTGMRGFYDKIIPDAANKLGKQWGAKVGDIKLSIPPSVSRSQWSYEGPEYDSHELISIANRWFKEDVPVTLAHQASAIAADMRESGYSFQDAMQRNGSAALAAKLGGKMKMAEAEKKTIPYLPLNPQMRTGIKSLPYSLFAAGGAALGLNAVKQKADELQRKFRESGLAQ